MSRQPSLELGIRGPHVRLAVEDPERRFVDICVPSMVGRYPLGTGDLVPLFPPYRENFIRHETAVRVVDVVLVVVAIEDRELGAIDRAELVCGDSEHERDESVDFDECLSPVLCDTQGSVGGPLLGDRTQVRAIRAWPPTCPLLIGECL